jgi:tRNA 2-thiouridine synthesizing protein E
VTKEKTINDIMHPGCRNPDFPDAPAAWTPDSATRTAREKGLELTDDHWKMLHALQEYYVRHEERRINVRELHDALDEMFHAQGGIKFLYGLFPNGPIALGCILAGLEPPAGATDKGDGSAV